MLLSPTARSAGGAWLNDTSNRVVIAPKQWFPHQLLHTQRPSYPSWYINQGPDPADVDTPMSHQHRHVGQRGTQAAGTRIFHKEARS